MTHNNCKLCKANVADKANSHIIPKFLCKSLFDSTKPRYTLIIDRDGRERKLQDTPKESYILCTICEKRIETIETHFAHILRDIHNYSNLSTKFNIRALGDQQYLECNNIHPTLFKLFIYSLIWRASISNLIEFNRFNISKESEEELRVFLDQNLFVKKTELMDSLEKIDRIPFYHSCLIKPKEKSNLSRGIFSTYSMSETSHILLLVDFALLFYTDERAIGNVLNRFSNKQNEKVIIALGDLMPWQELNRQVLVRLLGERDSGKGSKL